MVGLNTGTTMTKSRRFILKKKVAIHDGERRLDLLQNSLEVFRRENPKNKAEAWAIEDASGGVFFFLVRANEVGWIRQR